MVWEDQFVYMTPASRNTKVVVRHASQFSERWPDVYCKYDEFKGKNIDTVSLSPVITV